ncbi:hypothetical protein BZA05DRAFT_384572 [Tricharina praecox]|uniref:uncharacterized protein n=1 Tax=Tricharina praecox TaxID=43433 RepID=UPI00221F33AC|nr:uncharacterized protein BZA05DRAFT_384572 [Tricharina praecox]KAI5857709.1 hypothetical protein BZA05DRAFT_384572 [Tricharina praecox]
MQLHRVRLGTLSGLIHTNSISLVPHLYPANCEAPQLLAIHIYKTAFSSSLSPIITSTHQDSNSYAAVHLLKKRHTHRQTRPSHHNHHHQHHQHHHQHHHHTTPQPPQPPPQPPTPKMQQSYVRVTKRGNQVPVVPVCPPIDCPFKTDDGTTCGLRLTKASDIRDHFVREHGKGLVAKPYKCERCGKRHATPKQRNSHKDQCRRDPAEEGGEMELINYHLDQVERAIQTPSLTTTEGINTAIAAILCANQELSAGRPPAASTSSTKNSPTPQPSASPSAPQPPMLEVVPIDPQHGGHHHHQHEAPPPVIYYDSHSHSHGDPNPPVTYAPGYPAHSEPSPWIHPGTVYEPVHAYNIQPINPRNAASSRRDNN